MQKICEHCQNLFEAKHAIARFCSNACRNKARRLLVGEASPNYKGGKTKYACQHCEQVFESYHKERKYCSLACYKESGALFEQAKNAARRGGSGGVDSNQKEIVAGLRAVGATVLITSRVGHGFPDLLCGWNNRNVLLEVKNPATSYGRKGAQPNQKAWADGWEGEKTFVVFSLEEALAVVLC